MIINSSSSRRQILRHRKKLSFCNSRLPICCMQQFNNCALSLNASTNPLCEFLLRGSGQTAGVERRASPPKTLTWERPARNSAPQRAFRSKAATYDLRAPAGWRETDGDCPRHARPGRLAALTATLMHNHSHRAPRAIGRRVSSS